MSDTHARFCWTTRLCRIMLLHRGMSLSLGGDYDFDPYTMSLLSWDEHRGPAHLHHTMRRTPDPVPLCPLCTVFFRNTSYPHRPVENTHCPRGASPGSPHRRGRCSELITSAALLDYIPDFDSNEVITATPAC